MVLTPEQRKEFETVTRPVIEFLNNNCHPNVSVTVDCTRAELSEGVCSFHTEDYLRD